ncbi:hypothetical protein BH20ACT15_BH20ACT15_15830 [soil metagenome]
MANKRSRKRRKGRRRGTASAPSPSGPARAREPAPAEEGVKRASAARRLPGDDGPPPPPWGSFPLSELVILVALVMLVAGFFVGPPRGGLMLGTGLVLGSLAGLELAVREHFSGYRSHSMLLGGAVGIAVVAAMLLGVKAAPVVGAVAGAIALAVGSYLFASAFRRRSGGALFKVR